MAMGLLVVAYRDEATLAIRPKWLKPKGTRPIPKRVLRKLGLRSDWITFLNVMVSLQDVNFDQVQLEKPVPKKRGPKPKQAQ